jgi:hypothetical protein
MFSMEVLFIVMLWKLGLGERSAARPTSGANVYLAKYNCSCRCNMRGRLTRFLQGGVFEGIQSGRSTSERTLDAAHLCLIEYAGMNETI